MTEDDLAGILYTAAHKGLRNCWKWKDAGLDDEHPQSRGYWRKVARGLMENCDVSLKTAQGEQK